ncbi:hypothetical protein [Vulcanibacillus modesticaldus]|uniref:hypothetical protein n=1 Tax=Vulcanibacillus modesticaldus TaxID=337097 RepID=UPI00159F2AC6|nr:hypothetical protein [Vulcanibacillus modesticaldus]
MDKEAAFFSSMVVATVSLLSSIYIYKLYGFNGALITIFGAAVWVGIGFYFKNSK